MDSRPLLPPHQQPYAPPQTSGTAVASLVLGILSFVPGFLILTGIPGAFLGHAALRRMKKDPYVAGKGLAVAGVILCHFINTLTVLGILFVLFIIGTPIFFAHKSIEEERERLAAIQTVPATDAAFHVILPEGHDAKQPLVAAIWLHGYGWNPSHLVTDKDMFQEIANDLGIAVIGISATGKVENESWEWAEDLDMDREHINAVLEANADQVTLKPYGHILFGFSQGAKVAGDLAMNYPETYYGAIVMSPGGKKDNPDDPISSSLRHKKQTYYCLVGEDEAYGNVSLTREYASDARRLGAKVHHKLYPGVSEHSMPPDYEESLKKWFRKILESK